MKIHDLKTKETIILSEKYLVICLQNIVSHRIISTVTLGLIDPNSNQSFPQDFNSYIALLSDVIRQN